MKKTIRTDVLEDLGQMGGFVRLKLLEAIDLKLAAWEDGQIVPVTLVGVRAGKKTYKAGEEAELVVSRKVYSAALALAPRYVKRRLARTLR